MSIPRVQKSATLLPASDGCPLCGGVTGKQLLIAPDRFHGRKHLYELARCSSCGLVRLIDPPTPQEMPVHYSQSYHTSIENAGEMDLARRWKRHRDTVLNLKSGGAILDIGCGSGAFLRTLQGQAWRLHGVELSEQEAERARTQAGAEIFVGDPLEAPFAAESFDIITCFHLLEHVYEPFQLLKQIRMWLKPNGFLYVILPNIDSWEAHFFQSYWYGLELPRHLFHFSPASLERAMHAARLKTIRLHTLLEDSFSEHSIHYIMEELLSKCGVAKTPLSERHPPAFLFKVGRKAFRISIERLFRYAANAADRGASIEGVFSREGE
jgi:2-polyprenyl-3-methyl-5-hydroxy-6-metoxy-1,4-benzoquinol methylase